MKSQSENRDLPTGGGSNRLDQIVAAMREDWDKRAAADSQHYIYTPDGSSVPVGFDESGRINYDQLLAPFLSDLLDGRRPSECRVLEIGCGIGRMTACLAEHFQEVHALDVSPKMIELIRARLGHLRNIVFHVGSGMDLAGLPDNYFDFAFSFIVFQHIPSRGVIQRYINEAQRVLKPGAAFKFQVNGFQSLAFRQAPKDTWVGETFSFSEMQDMILEAGLRPMAADGVGTQYFFLSGRKPRLAAGRELDQQEEARWQRVVIEELRRLEALVLLVRNEVEEARLVIDRMADNSRPPEGQSVVREAARWLRQTVSRARTKR